MNDWQQILQTLVGRVDDFSDRARLRLKKLAFLDSALMLIPYLGYGTQEKLLLSGRVLKDEGFAPSRETDTSWRNLVELYKRLESDEVPGARVRARFQGVEHEAIANHEGYFSFEIKPAQPLGLSAWHVVDLELIDPASAAPVRAAADVLVPPATTRFGIISDIDDTVLWTNVSRKLKMLLLVALSNAHTRKPFNGVAAFYRALQRGAGGSEGNPIFYVSSSPWNLYTPLIEFLNVQTIPLGPLLLKDYGDHTLFSTGDHRSHKLASIERILKVFPRLSFILIGDSGEQDPEIYSEVVRMYPQRVRAIYIRSVASDPSRIQAIDKLIDEVRQTGAQLILAPDSEFAAVHAAGEGLISTADLAAVRSNKREDERAQDPQGLLDGKT
ncbi:MAG: DUF2183 domain-containing protein [Burkholderiales bacterium]|nr:DUF2183 domain-containing protein [Burkholderiales bacterium]